MATSDVDLSPAYMKEEGELSDDEEINNEEPALCFEYAHGIGFGKKDLLTQLTQVQSKKFDPQAQANYGNSRIDNVAGTKPRREIDSRHRSNYCERPPLRDRDALRRRYDHRVQNLKGYEKEELWDEQKRSPHRPFSYTERRSQHRYDHSPPRRYSNSSSSHSWFKKRFRTSSGSSHVNKEDEDFEALLREHKYIQDQLEKLETEELAANENSGDSEASGIQRSKNRKDASKPRPKKISDTEDTKSPKPEIMDIATKLDQDFVAVGKESDNEDELRKMAIASVPEKSDDEDELRKLVLASVAEKTQTNTNISEEAIEEGRKQEVSDLYPERKPVKRSSGLTRSRHSSADRRREQERQSREKHYEERARRRQDYEARRKRELLEEKHRQMMDVQRREIQRILTLDDPQEQAERFLNLLKRGRGPEVEDIKQPPVMRHRKEILKKPEHVDNYEEVEMDLDSDEGDAAVIETGLDDSLLYEDSVPLNNTSTPLPFMDFYLPAALQAQLYQSIFPGYNNYPYLNRPSQPHHKPTSISAQPPYHSPLKQTSSSELHPPLPLDEPKDSVPPPLPPPLDPVKIPLPPPLPDSPPPPLPPPVLQENPPLPKENEVQEDDDEDEGEELMLREQLLLSMKRRQEEKLQELMKSDVSPSSSRGQSPAPISVVSSKPREKKAKSRPMQIPIHKPVIIRLNADSSSSESDSESSVNRNPLENLDVFLKAARKNVEERDREKALNADGSKDTEEGKTVIASKNNAILTSKVKEYEAELQRQRKQIENDDMRFKVMLTKIAKHLRIQASSEETIQMLRKQLDAQEKILSDAKDIVQKTRIEARKLKQTLIRHKESFRETEKKVTLFGQEVFGAGYLPISGTVKSIALHNKRKVEIVKGTRETGIKRKRINKQDDKENQNVIRKQSLDKIAQEKEKLLKREKELAEKMKLLRGFNLLEDKKKVVMKEKEKEKVIPRLEKIDINVNEVVDSTPKPVKRRRSLMEMSKSMTPVIERSDISDTPVKATERNADGHKLNFSLPDGKQLANLCKLQEEKMQKYLSSHQNRISMDDSTDYLSCIGDDCQKVKNLSLPEMTSQQQPNKDDSVFKVPSLCYRSKLLHFKSYRFNMNFRSKENLSISSPSFCSKLNPRRMLCRYDLMGKCNDESCTEQHEADYKLNESEILQDIVSYWPAIAGVTSDLSAEQSKHLIGKYVDKFMRQHEGKVNFDEMCLLLNSIVSRKAGKNHPNTTFLDSRKWHPTGEVKIPEANGNFDLQSSKKKDEWKLNRNKKCEMENIITDQDVRYFVLSADDIHDMESAVLENPQLEDLWIKLAYKKLNDHSLDDELCLKHALNILARGIEANKTSVNLWQHYLSLYSKRCSTEEMSDICQVAVHHAPCYQIWWQYLKSVASFETKNEICDQILLYLLDEENLPKGERSHYLLETVLYKIDLNVQTGRYKTALNYIKNMLAKPNHSTGCIAANLIPCDRMVLWLSYVHLIEFHHLPAQLYDPANQQSGKIVNKKNLLIPWKKKSELMTKPELLLKLLWDAAQSFLPVDESSMVPFENMHLNIINLCVRTERLNDAISICRKMVRDFPHMTEIWLCGANLYAKKLPKKTTQIFNDSIVQNPTKSKLYYHYAKWELSQGNSDKAAEILANCINSFFHADDSIRETPNANLLYCKVLGQELPLTYTSPPLKICDKDIQKELLYLWLCYCLLLELQRETHQASESYETAYCKLSTLEDLGQIIQSYLHFQIRMIGASKSNISEVQKFHDIAKRFLATLPNKQSIPFSNGHYWCDYTVLNACISTYIHCFPEDKWLQMYGKFVDVMPNNVKLQYSVCEHYIAEGELFMALSLCKRTQYENAVDVEFWKLVLAICLNLGMTAEVRKQYHRAVKAMPLSISLWKDFLLFEVSQGNEETVRRITDHCYELGLNIQGFIATISK